MSERRSIKKFSNSYFFLACVFGIFGCEGGHGNVVPKNFEIILESYGSEHIRLMSGEFVKPINGKIFVAHFTLSPQEKLSIYNLLAAKGLLDLEVDFVPRHPGHRMHQTFFDVKILQGTKVRNVKISNCDYGFLEGFKARCYLDVMQSIDRAVKQQPEVKNLHISDGIRF